MRVLLYILLSCSTSCLLFAQSDTYDIYALKFGERSNYVYLKNEARGDKTEDSTKVFFMFWLLKNEERTVLVDAGFTSDASQDSLKVKFISPDKVLARIGIKPGEVTDIIITHPHWDHIGGISLYPKARVWMQEEDFKDLTAKRKDPEAIGYNKMDIQKVNERKENGTLKLLKNHRDEVILPGITVLTGSKHTPGSQFVLANNGKQNTIIASDNCKYYRNVTGSYSIPGTSDQKAYVRNLRSMKQTLLGKTDFVIPGHDPLVFSKFKTVAPDVVQILERKGP